MRKTLYLLMFSATFSALAFAETFSGKLVDAGCYAKQQNVMGCDASSATKAFAIEVSGKLYNLDSAGNQKASTAIKNRADRAADPTKAPPKEVMAKIEGAVTGETITVETVEVQ